MRPMCYFLWSAFFISDWTIITGVWVQHGVHFCFSFGAGVSVVCVTVSCLVFHRWNVFGMIGFGNSSKMQFVSPSRRAHVGVHAGLFDEHLMLIIFPRIWKTGSKSYRRTISWCHSRVPRFFSQRDTSPLIVPPVPRVEWRQNGLATKIAFTTHNSRQ